MSSRLLSSKYFDKLQVNKLETQQLKVNQLINNPSYLFSLLTENGTFTPNDTGGIIKFNKTETNVIEFTDRPLRKTNNEYDLDYLIDLFLDESPNSFKFNPPN